MNGVTFITVSSTWGNGNNLRKEQMLARTMMITMPCYSLQFTVTDIRQFDYVYVLKVVLTDLLT